MGLVHTPRTLFYVAKGLVRRQKGADPNGFGANSPFVTTGRAGLFDCDYLLHLNNAAYLSYAEYARWEMCAYNGLLKAMARDQMAFVVGGTVVRYRKEIRPLFRKFEVHSYVAHLDQRNLWIYHTFRYPPGGDDPGRIRAQVLCQGLAIQGRNVLDPRKYLKENVGIDADLIDELSQETEENTLTSVMEKYSSMEDSFKEAATEDDQWLSSRSKK